MKVPQETRRSNWGRVRKPRKQLQEINLSLYSHMEVNKLTEAQMLRSCLGVKYNVIVSRRLYS